VSSADKVPASWSIAGQIDAQKQSNLSALPHYDAFAGHREHLTELTLRGVSPEAKARLAVIGAGNCYDLDLERLASIFAEVHLVDIDDAALAGACERQPASARAKLFRHAPVDLSGFMDKLDKWAAGHAQPEDLMELPVRTSRELLARLPGPFDVVLSSCLLTQIHFTALNVLSDKHPLFEAVREIASLTHLRVLAALTAPGGRALLATELASNVDRPLPEIAPGRDPGELLREVVDAGQSIHVSDPRRLAWLAQIDPMLRGAVRMSEPLGAWLWQNGAERVFLVYAVELRRAENRGKAE
jgi:hypothetical protein